MGDLFVGAPAAHARREDPDTSHQAAAAITPELPQLQARVADYARRKGDAGFTDAQMSSDLNDASSTLRTRRSELTARNIILDSGIRRRWGDSPRERIVWMHRDFVQNPPDVLDAPAGPVTASDRAAGMAMADKLAGFAVSLGREGRTPLSAELHEASNLMRRLAAE